MGEPRHTDSWYAASANPIAAQPTLEQELTADVCVLGAGITGLSLALNLAEAGYRVIVLEAQLIGWGASGRSGGQMIFGYGCDQDKIEALVGKPDARKIWDASLHAIDLTRARIKQHQIDCDLQAGHVHAAIKPRQMRELAHWQDDLSANYGYQSTELWDRERIGEELGSERYLGGLFDANSGHLHPLNYTLGLAQAALDAGVRIFENSAVQEVIEGNELVIKTSQGCVRAQFLGMAGNAYLNRVAPKIESRVMPVGTYIAATEPLGEARCRELIKSNAAVADVNFVLDYYRCSSDYRLLFGGRVSYSTRQPINLARSMYRRMLAVYPQLAGSRIDYAWGGLVAITINRAPHFGRLGNNILFAHGFSGHGIAMTGLAGKLIADTIRGQAEQFDLISRLPHLPFPGGRLLRTPALVLAMAWYRLRDLLP